MKLLRRQSLFFGCLISIGVFVIILVIMSQIRITPMSVYTNQFHRFRMKYPTYWTKVDKKLEVGVVAFVAPKRTDLDLFATNVSVTWLIPDKPGISLNDFASTAVKQVKGTFNNNIKVISGRNIRLGRPRIKAFEFIYEGQAEGLEDPIRYDHVITLTDRGAFIITYAANRSHFDEHLGTFKKMLNSFELY